MYDVVIRWVEWSSVKRIYENYCQRLVKLIVRLRGALLCLEIILLDFDFGD